MGPISGLLRRIVRRSRSVPGLYGRLVLLTIAASLPLLMYGLWDQYASYRRGRAELGDRVLELARGMAGTVERELTTRIAALQALARTEALRTNDRVRIQAELEHLLSLQRTGTSVAVTDEEGRPLFVSGLPLGSPPSKLPPGEASVAAAVSRTGQPAVSGVLPGTASSPPKFSVAVPVMRKGTVHFVVSLYSDLAILSSIVAQQRLPPGWIISIFDGNGVNLARAPNGDRFVGVTTTAPLLAYLRPGKAEAVFDSATLEGFHVLGAFSRVQPFGWGVAVGVPLSQIITPLLRNTLETLAGAALTLAVALSLAQFVARGITRPILALRDFAVSPDRDISPVTTGLRETDAVARSLREEAERRQIAEAELRALNQNLETRVAEEVAARELAQIRAAHGEHMQALGQLAGGVAHDFNNVLQSVSAALTLISQRASDETAVRRFTRIAADATDRGTAIARRLLAFARRNDLRAEALDPAVLLQDLREVLQPVLGPTIKAEIDARRGLPPMFADKAQLETALVNLVMNARDAMPDGGTVTLSAEAEHVTEAASHPAELPPGQYIRLCVGDTGSGIEPAMLTRVLEPFFTTKQQGKGTGLGLSMAKGFAEQSGGGLAIRSSLGKGTVVSVWLREMVREQAGSAPPEQRGDKAVSPQAH